MDRSELYALNDYKREELKKRLVPVTDWNKVESGQYIFHDTDTSIMNRNKFISIDKDGKLIKYYNCIDQKVYEYSVSGWYYYDESIADEIEENWTPKLYIVIPVDQSEEYELVVACNENHLYSCFLEKHQEIPKEELTLEQFKEFYYYDLIKEVDGFNIECN